MTVEEKIRNKHFKPGKPAWLKVKLPGGEAYNQIKRTLRSGRLHTVCEEAKCPNVSECFGGGTATFMLLGDTCTRACRFCAVKSAKHPPPLDDEEPQNIATSAKAMGLTYVVLTSVDRDDLADGGAAHIAKTIRAIKQIDSKILCEALIPDFQGSQEALRTVVEAKPEVLAHNVETVRRLTSKVRDPRASYDQSLDLLQQIKSLAETTGVGTYTKSSIMVGVGETFDETIQTMEDLRSVQVDILTIGQYLQPNRRLLPVEHYVEPKTFDQFRELGLEMGFLYVASGPLVRTSYRAGEFFMRSLLQSRKSQVRPTPKKNAPPPAK